MGNKKVIALISLFSVMLLLLTGCWDEVELEERAFVSGVAVDLAEEHGGKITFEMTEQVVVPGGLGTTTQPGGGQAFRNVGDSSESLFEINTNISRQLNRKTNVEHLDLIIVSSELAKKKELFADILDVFVRQQNMRRGIILAIADEKAKDLLYVEPEHIKIPSKYITELMENNESPITSETTRLGDIQENLLMGKSYTIPLLSMVSDKTIEYEGVALFHGQTSRLVDTLKDDEAKGLHFIIGRNQRGSVISEVEGKQTSFVITEGDSKYKLTNNDKNNLTFQVDINITAQITEYFGTMDLYKNKSLRKFERALQRRIKTMAEKTLEKVKDDLQVDVLQFDRYLRIHHNKLWEEIKEDWDHGENYFSQSDIEINVKANVTEPGTSVRMRQKGEQD
ncbi:Ger(x)C family spore germination protein [Oceanobacillus senegalensis]|uniref:Ger(x)C family spore germination protein n=1 Tax=Oceanobacillus senegalensis TaxID=1936063 RepID=UPI0015C4C7B3|nr:Ger(x)C family spore germination protein [Oceanobacillus senegalensis]